MGKQTKYIFVTGGVISGIGKGISFASIGRILKNQGYKIFTIKLDPYLNYDPGTMSPFQHGEVFVTADGGETDLDLGHYERFIDVELTKSSSVTSGRVYNRILSQERKGIYGGSTVQVVPHVTNEIKNYIKRAAIDSDADIVMCEIGGTVGDIESEPFIEAARQMRMDVGYDNTFFVHLTLVPYIESTEEYKTKPTQHSVKTLRSMGVSPDLIVLRSRGELSKELKDKVALFCDVKEEAVVNAPNLKNVYELPISYEKQNVDDIILSHFKLEHSKADMSEWINLCQKIKRSKEEIKIGIIGKYVKLHDAYLSLSNALQHAGYFYEKKVVICWIESDLLTDENVVDTLQGIDAFVIPGGFGVRGVEGKITAAKYARENNIPILGICLGMQVEAIEFARNVLKLDNADSTEFTPDTKYPIIQYLDGQYDGINLGGTLRLGNYDCKIKEGTKAYDLYGEEDIKERHRHRYEFNNDFKEKFEKNGMLISGANEKLNLVEMLELKNHPFYIGCQYHPEFKSRPNRPHPLFLGLIKAAIDKKLS